MKTLLNFCLLGLFFISANAQKITWADELDKRRFTTISQIVGVDGDDTYAIMYHRPMSINGIKAKDKYYIARFNKSLDMVANEELMFKEKKTKLDYAYTQLMNGKLYSFAVFENHKLLKRFLFVYELDKKTLKVKSGPKKIAETNISKVKFSIGLFDSGFSRDRGAIMHAVSNDSSHIALLSRGFVEKGKDAEFLLQVFDSEMNLSWEQKVSTEVDDQLLALTGLKIDNMGNAYILSKEYFKINKNGKKGKLKIREEIDGVPNFQYSIMAYRYQGLEAEDYLINPKNIFLKQLRLETNKQNDLIIFGVFADENSYRKTSGIYYKMLDGNTGAVKAEKQEKFTQEYIDQFAEREKDKGEDEVWNINAYKIIPMDNGDFVVLGEIFYSWYATSYSTNGGQRSVLMYNYEDMLFWRINPEDGLVWSSILPKYQSVPIVSTSYGRTYFFTDDANRVFGGVGSFTWAIADNGVKVMYCENPRQKKDFKKKGSGVTSRLVWSSAEVNWDGKPTNRILTSNIPKKAYLVPGSCAQTGPNKMLLIANEGRSYYLGTALFD